VFYYLQKEFKEIVSRIESIRTCPKNIAVYLEGTLNILGVKMLEGTLNILGVKMQGPLPVCRSNELHFRSDLLFNVAPLAMP